MSLPSQKLLVMNKPKSFKRLSRVKLFLLLLIFTPVINLSEHLLNSYWRQWQLITDSSAVVFAQSLRPEKVSAQVYQALPDLPQENNYINKETQEIVTENTLITRIVRYHQYTKTRPTIFRLDWKLTLADYLGKNEIIKRGRYPGYSTLTENPLEADRQAISNLTMEQREALVNVLVSIYNPNYQNSSTTQSPTEGNSSSSTKKDSSPSFQLPQRGGAELLLP